MATDDQRQVWREQKQTYRQNKKEYTVIFSENEAQVVQEYASLKSMGVPEFLKAIVKAYEGDVGYILPKESLLKELILQLRYIGNNLNQTVRYINSNKYISVSDIQALNARLSEMEDLIISALTEPPRHDH